MSRQLLCRLLTRRSKLRLAVVLLLVGLIAPQVWAWTQLRSAKSSLAKYHPQEARTALASCARVWGDRPSIRLLSCRAAWQAGDTESATAELRAAQRLTGGATDETAFEWALLQASTGNVREVEVYLQRRADQSPDVAGPLIWEALAVGYLQSFRTLDAMACLEHWLKRQPDNVRALELRGATFVAGKGVVRGLEDYRRVLELDSTRWATRWRLIEGLIALGGYEEAAGHLELFARENPDDPAVAARLARCYYFNGRRDEARRLLDEALIRHPDHGLSLRTRGQIALMDDQKPEAEKWLRQAAALMPDDYQAQWLFFEALRQQGKSDEAKAQSKKAEEVKERVTRISELSSRTLAQSPLDPAPHYEMGTLLIGSGRGEVGERWLLAALDLDPDHKPSHTALAAYYESRGDKAKADFHRARATDQDKK
ncbi:MAG: tetratricopeptide repeat protein [Planctomycetia bacterium]|nr:tetratricopeptide repeat protein [Planctomycetia bacterium]